MTNRERAEVLKAELERDPKHPIGNITRALDEATAAAESRAREAEAQNERYRKSIAITDRNFRAMQTELDAARELIEAKDDLGEYLQHTDECATRRFIENDCTCGCAAMADRYFAALAKYDAARGAR